MNPTNLANTAVFQKLKKHAEKAGKWSLKELFRNDPGRFPAMTLTAGGLFLDFSKNFLTKETLSLLLELAKECDLEKIRDRMFEGDKINTTEHRAVLHTALRAPRYEKVLVDGKNVIPDIQAVLDQMRRFSEKIHSGEWKGFTGKPITDIVNIGIGGSDVGPRMVCQAMRPFHIKELNVHFVANVDGHDLDMVLNRVRPETTLFIIASKTFTTLETMLNAAFIMTTCSPSGTGWAVVTPSGPLSACLSYWLSATTISRNFWRVPTRWMFISDTHLWHPTCLYFSA